MSERRASAVADTDAGPTADPVAVPCRAEVGPSATTSAAATQERQVLAGRYEILALVGNGGMGSVYQVHDAELDEIVALKIVRRELVVQTGMLDRFRSEVKLARKVTHRNVARTFDIGEHEGEKFLTMEYVEGVSLAERIAQERWLPYDEIRHIAIEVAEGLAAAHEAGVLHRDLKPDNVLLAKDGRVVITDFGIALAYVASNERRGLMVGTPAYMSPEQVVGNADLDARADVYSLGVTLYEMVTGQRAWPGDDVVDVTSARLVQAPPDPRWLRDDVPEPWVEIIRTCMARGREDRYASAADVAAALAALAPVASVPAVAPAAGLALAPRAVGAATPGAPRVVAVLPIRNTGPASDEYVADGLTEDLIDALSMTEGLRVRPRGAVGSYRGVDQDPREIGRALEVEVVVDGSVRRTSAGVRIHARAISVAEGFQLWARRFDASEADLLRINDQVARAVAAALTLVRRAPDRQAASDPQAIDLYLRARHEHRKFWREHIARACELYELALARTPDDPTILSGYAVAQARMLFFDGSAGSAEIATRAADKALALAPHLGEAHFALASVRFQQGDVEMAARALRAAVVNAPGLADAHTMLGRILGECGRAAEAVKRLEIAAGIDPQAPYVFSELARIHALSGEWDRYDDTIAKAEANEGQGAVMLQRARTLLWRRDTARCAALVGTFPVTSDVAALASATLVLGGTGVLPAEQDAFVRDMAANERIGYRLRNFFLQVRAEIEAFRGNDAAAGEAIVRAIDGGLLDLLWLDRCPLFVGVRERIDVVVARGRLREQVDHLVDLLVGA